MKNVLLIISLFFLHSLLFSFTSAANRYSKVTGSWNATSTWSETSGGAAGASVPVNGDAVYIEGGRTVTITANAACTSLNIAAGSALTVGGYTFTVTGASSISGTITFNSATGPKTFTGAVTLNSGAVWNETAAPTFSLPAGLTNNATTFTANTGAHSISATLAGNTPTSIPNFVVPGTGLTNNGTLTIGTNLTASGTLTNAASGVLNIANTYTFYVGTLIATAVGNTVNYTGAAQTVKSGTYYNLGLSSTGIKTTTSVTFNGELNISGDATVHPSVTLSYNNSSSSLVYSGNVSQTTGLEFKNSLRIPVSINNANGVTLGGNKTLHNSLTFINGNLNTGSYTLTLGTTAPTGSIVGESGAGYFIGNLAITRTVGTGASSLGDIGLSIASGVDDLGDVTVMRATGAATSGNGNAGITRYWDISSTNPPTSGRDLSFSWLMNEDNGVDLTNALVFKSEDNGATWTSFGSVQDVSSATEFRTISAPGVTSFSRWTVASETLPLPVELTSFNASVNGNNITLQWNTATEIKNYGFDVERSVISNAVKNLSWVKIGFVNGNGNSNSPKNYSFVDNKVSAGKYAYRLKQIDNNGQFEYSKNVEVSLMKPNEFKLEQNYPNPFNPSTAIRFNLPEASAVKITIFNILGQEIRTLVNEFKESGVNTINFDASDLKSGIYIYKIEAGNFVQTRKMTLLK